MYSVVEIKGHQYRVQPGDLVDVELMDAEVGSMIDLTNVLFVGGDQPKVGTPNLAGAKVVAKVLKHDRSKKLIVLKRKPGRYIKANGHRQNFTALLITEVNDGAGKVVKIEKDSHNGKKYLK